MSVDVWVERFGGPDGPERYRRYTLATVVFLAATEAALWAFWIATTEAGTLGLALVAGVGTVHVAVQARLSRAALLHYLGAGPRPVWLVALYAAVTVAMAALGCALLATGRIHGGNLAAYLVWLLMYYAGPPMLALPRRAGAMVVGAVPVVALGAAAASGLSGGSLALVIGAGLLMVPFMAIALRVSGWSVRLIEELARARATQARLAVAEERLRFGRDLHDVLGRNLAVVALKSELAVELARRGREEAVAQMEEVQRIAQESQREIRAVVRGYRTADLHAELAGARSVLEAAGIDCRIENGPAARLPARTQVALGWVVREGTTNVLRHAQGASRCEVSVRTTISGSVALLMENDGADPDPRPGTGSGLPGLRERLAEVDGALSTERHPDGTFRLTATIPWETAE
ncbi:sensor histidine kinase [Streptomyces rugosispiralis]|uniref:Histidine kinase n=1 Tax=Streptomyces rugosispiralis TaxID=2967341 RepID=A0ABT1USP1_9ACTN|nr:histidine kinase [Streptomyces rugosispiralis]MCQ8188125.1 histidine kinase [Streptomyces rugosispiralis]